MLHRSSVRCESAQIPKHGRQERVQYDDRSVRMVRQRERDRMQLLLHSVLGARQRWMVNRGYGDVLQSDQRGHAKRRPAASPARDRATDLPLASRSLDLWPLPEFHGELVAVSWLLDDLIPRWNSISGVEGIAMQFS